MYIYCMFQNGFFETIGEVHEITEPQLKQEIEDMTSTRCVLMSFYPLPSENNLHILWLMLAMCMSVSS